MSFFLVQNAVSAYVLLSTLINYKHLNVGTACSRKFYDTYILFHNLPIKVTC